MGRPSENRVLPWLLLPVALVAGSAAIPVDLSAQAGRQVYLALGTGTVPAGVDDAAVRQYVIAALMSMPNVVRAPDGESSADAERVIASTGRTGRLLDWTVQMVDTAGGLRVNVRMSVASYPGGRRLGSMTTSATATGVHSPAGVGPAIDRAIRNVVASLTPLP